MLDFSDKPYCFFPPRPRQLVTAIAQLANRRIVLPGRKHRVQQIELRHADRILPIIKSTTRCLLLPNHSTHSDPQMMFDVQRRLQLNTATMAAYDVFLRGKLQAWFMQSIGCFSVDRDGSDKLAMNCAVGVLTGGKRALTIFPEGNVLLMNDRVAPFLGGAAFIGMRAQKKIGPDQPIYAIPISLKFSLLEDCQSTIAGHLESLESRLNIESGQRSKEPLRRRMKRIGLETLSRNLRQRGFMEPCSHEAELSTVLRDCAISIIETLEKKIALASNPKQPPIDRIRRIRAAIHQTRIDDSQQIDHRVAHSWADEAILALRILSYSSDYLAEAPTLDRHAETLEKLREDLAEKILPPIGDRKAVIQFGDPICLADYLDAKNARQTLNELTTTFEQAVQSGLDDINSRNECPGGRQIE